MKFKFSHFLILFLLVTLFTSCSSLNTLPTSNQNRSIANSNIDSCNNLVKELLAGARFLHENDSTLHQQKNIIQASKNNSEISKPVDKIAYWLSKLESSLSNTNEQARLRDIETIKRYYQFNHIIKKNEVPESYFELQKRIAREQGHGDVQITESMRAEMIETLRSDQKQALNAWMDYFLSEDADVYPIWVKYWSFEGMLKLGIFDEEAGKFSKRTSSTVAPFVELNREAFANVVDSLVKQTNGDSLEDLTDETFKDLLKSGASIGRLYGRQLKLLKENGGNVLTQTQGRWVKYEQGSSADELVESLKGKNTGWCTAGHSTATTQLQNGDFYVYYSKDQKGGTSTPRLAIRMESNRIGEVRGIGANQNIDEYIAKTNILDKKLREFGDEGERYEKRSIHMKRLTEIENKNKKGTELSKEDLRFLYEIDEKIEGFGYVKDPRIAEILNERNIKKDLAYSMGFKESDISLRAEEMLKGGIKYHHGDLNLNSIISADELKLPERISGDLDLFSLESADGLKLPESIGGSLYLSSISSADGLKMPERIGGVLDLRSLISADGLKLPKSIGGDLILNSLKSAEGLKMPESIGGRLDLRLLISANGLKLPESIGGNLNLKSLKTANGLKLPKNIGGALILNSLKSAEGLKMPESIGGCLELRSLTSVNGLTLPKSIGEWLYLNSLKSVDGLIISPGISRERIFLAK